ncbi:MAG TPA: hypothetical protein PK379_07445 [Candidatus Hydrogenedentes bacterium]|nr:hypothetical protein [Candidatus Hydrogenedentota bacterium]HOJ67573.1 hypothetical protein [Candidatus Hydrogenedentota bacterium]HOK89846.1 hypothetical protein [Candidatus Hydrogenedentota bacterium]
MTRLLALACMVPLLVGCGSRNGTPPDRADRSESGREATDRALRTAADAGMEMTGIDLYVHRKNPMTGVAQSPKLWIHADQFSLRDSQTYAFESARAVVYGEREEDRLIVMEAGRGIFEQDRKADLSGGVVVTAGTLVLRTEAATWEQVAPPESEQVRVDTPLTIDDPRLVLAAGSARLYPERKEFELRDARGTIRFGEGT